MPLISVSGPQGLGKTTFIKDFIKEFPMYKTPEKTYRDIVKEKGLTLNKNADKRSQGIIIDSLIEQLDSYARSEKIIFDRSPLDGLVYSIWSCEKQNSDIDEEFILEYQPKVRKCIQRLDLMFLIPISKYNNIPLVKDGFREVDPEYQKEINALFTGLKELRENEDDAFFVREDCAPFIEIFGSQEERIELVKHYVNDDGDFYGEDDCNILDALGNPLTQDMQDDVVDEGEVDQLKHQLGIQ